MIPSPPPNEHFRTPLPPLFKGQLSRFSKYTPRGDCILNKSRIISIIIPGKREREIHGRDNFIILELNVYDGECDMRRNWSESERIYIHTRLDWRMNGWLDGWMDGWLGGWVGWRVVGWNEWMDGLPAHADKSRIVLWWIITMQMHFGRPSCCSWRSI